MSGYAVVAEDLVKVYRLYARPSDRIKESFHPLRRRYHTPFRALDGVSLTIRAGETFGIVGKNGSGKSTLLKILTGTLTPTSGRLSVAGRVAALLELGAGFNPEMTGIENIFFSGTIMGFTRREMEAKLERIVDFADIGDFIHQPAKLYSSGMFARLAFAVNTAVEPDVFIVDEALAVGDAAFVQRCMVRFRDMQKRGATIILVTHDASMVRQLCGRALWLERGRIRMLGDALSVTEAYTMEVHGVEPGRAGARGQAPPGAAGGKPEEARQPLPMPKVDRRAGDQKVSIVGLELCDAHEKPADSLPNDSWAVLRVAVRNNSAPSGAPLAVGYLVRNRLGVDVASSDNICTGQELGSLEPGETAAFRVSVKVPLLYPQSYSISPSAGYLGEDGNWVMSDFIENAICFDITSALKINIQMSFESDFSRES